MNELEALIQGRHYEQALEQGGELLDQVQAPAARALLHRCLGHALCRLRRLTEACKQLNLAETLFVSLGSRGLVAQTMELRALALQIAEQPEALSVAEQALDRYRALRQRRPEVESRLLERLGTILAGRGDYEAARVHYKEAFKRAAGVRGVDIKAGVLRQARARLQLSLAQVGGNELTREAVRLIETGKVSRVVPEWCRLELRAAAVLIPGWRSYRRARPGFGAGRRALPGCGWRRAAWPAGWTRAS